MSLYDLISPIGILAAVFFGVAILNYFVKIINKRYISKLGKDKKRVVDVYRKIMKIIIKYHKVAGSIAVILVLVHFCIGFIENSIVLPGVIAAILMLMIFFLGIYGVYISKNIRGSWVKFHRILAFILLAAIVIHIVLLP